MNAQLSLFASGPSPRSERRNLVIEAGAGTGKTTAIVAEVLKLLLADEELAPERIVLVTFTEKAAGEIADRIRAALIELDAAFDASDAVVWPIGSPRPLLAIDDDKRASARRACTKHLAHIDALRSQTIHSFCQSLLRTFPIEANLDPQFKIIEGFERSLLYGQLYDAWVDLETRVDPRPERIAEWELLFEHAGYLFQVRDLIFALVERRDLLNEHDRDHGTLDDVEPSLIDALVWIRREASSPKDDAAARVAAYIRGNEPPHPGSLDAWITYLKPIAPAMRDIDLRYCAPLKDAMVVLRSGDKGDSIYDRLTSHRAALALLALSRRFIEYLDDQKRRLGVVDFDDLLLRTAALLDDAVVLERARNQFDFLFVDEFQDTDRTQARILDRLARGRDHAYVPGKTIVVGDPKQSIYAFRRADPETYAKMTSELQAGGAEPREIRDQYRSEPRLLETINAIFERVFAGCDTDPNVFRPPYRRLEPRKAATRDADAHVTLLHASHEERSERFFAEAEAIAEWILRNGGDLRRYAILFRRLTKLDDYLDTLDRYCIDYVLPPTRMFLDRRAPVDLLAVLRAIAWPFDLGARISAARTPYFALTDIEIAEQGEAWAQFSTALAEYGEASRHLTVSQLIDHVIATRGIEAIYDATVDGVRHRRHLEHVRAIAFEYDQTIGGSVRQFADEISRRRAEPDEMEPSLLDESRNAVRILSVHAAKGLEFDCVILPDLAFPSIQSDNVQLFTVDEPRSLVMTGRVETLSANFRKANGAPLKKIAAAREDAEMLRLFYVAVTRAKQEVVFVLDPKANNTGFAKCLRAAFGIDKTTEWPESGREVRELEIGAVAFERQPLTWPSGPVLSRGAGEDKAQPLSRSAGEDRRGAPGEGLRLTQRRHRLVDQELEARLATGPLEPLTLPTLPPVAEALDRGTIAALRAGSPNRIAGTLLHRVLEQWDGRSEVEPLVRMLAAEVGADDAAVNAVRRRLAVIAKSELFRRIAAATPLGRELPVRFTDENGIVVERRIDRLVRETDGDLVIDYKSGTPAKKDEEQVARYCRAVERMTGRPCAGILWYVGIEHERVVPV